MNTETVPNECTSFPAVVDRDIAGAPVQTVNARDLHTFLEVGKDFSNWIKDRIETFSFKENSDFVVFAETGEKLRGGRPAKEYAVSLDMAKELSMVERNERGKQARLYFIECERRAKQRPVIDVHNPAVARIIGGIVKSVIHKELTVVLDGMVKAAVAESQYTIAKGYTAGEVVALSKVKGIKGLANFVSRRLDRYHKIEGIPVRLGQLGTRCANLFDPSTCRKWLQEGGKAEIERRIAERGGQRVLPLRPVP